MPIVELSDRSLRGATSPLSPPPPRAPVPSTGAASAYVNISEQARRALVDARSESILARVAAPSLVANGPVTTELLARLAVSRADTRSAAASADAPLGLRRAPPPPREASDTRAEPVGPRYYDDLQPALLPPPTHGVDPVAAFAQLAASAGYYALRSVALDPDPDAWREAESPVRIAYTKHERYVPPRGTRVSLYA